MVFGYFSDTFPLQFRLLESRGDDTLKANYTFINLNIYIYFHKRSFSEAEIDRSPIFGFQGIRKGLNQSFNKFMLSRNGGDIGL